MRHGVAVLVPGYTVHERHHGFTVMPASFSNAALGVDRRIEIADLARSRFLGIRWLDDQLERAAVTQSDSSEVAYITRG
jgi:hypothetical protein